MYPDDRVLVAYVPAPSDFRIIEQEGWYRIPQKYVPKGVNAEYFAFYFGNNFGPQKWAIHFYAENQGHELVTRKQLMPHQSNHPRANELYYKIQLGPLQKLAQPIISMRWRRITFIHTTGDRFLDAVEINDLFLTGDVYVDRLFVALKEKGIEAQKNYQLKENQAEFSVPLTILCKNGRIDIQKCDLPKTDRETQTLLLTVAAEIKRKGGLLIG